MDRRPDRLTAAKHPDDVPDADLLRRYAGSGCPDAFAALVDRYLPLIYSAALRQARDPHLAEDAAQATLIILSQKAGRVDPATLPGWLLKVAHYAARNAVRQCARRTRHERRAAALRPESHTPGDPDLLSPAIDPALARLGDADRTAIVLRYFQDMSFADIAARLRTTEAAAQRRVSRAIEKLRATLAGRGVAVAPAALPAALASRAARPVPPALAGRASSLATLKTPATAVLAKGALYAMAATKLKVAAAAAVAVLLVGVAAPTVYRLTAREPAFIPAAPPAASSFPQPVSGSLPPGMGAEPVAAARLADKRWFGPDGKPVAGIPDRLLTIAARLAPDATHAFCYHVTAPPPGSGVGYVPLVEGTGGYGSGSFTDRATGSEWSVIGFPLDPASDALTLTVRASDRPITTNAVVPATSKDAFHGTIANHPLTVNPPAEQGGKARLGITFGAELPDVQMTVYAIDTAGKKVWHASTGLLDGKLGSREYVYKVPLSALREFRVESRPYNYHARYAPVPLAPVK